MNDPKPIAPARPPQRPTLKGTPIELDVERIRLADLKRARQAERRARGMQP